MDALQENGLSDIRCCYISNIYQELRTVEAQSLSEQNNLHASVHKIYERSAAKTLQFRS